ncbi:MAG: GAF domain-containing protein, partial [Lacisediminihabitans sp.]
VRFDRIVMLAQSLFETQGAAFSLVDGDRYWYKTLIGGSWTEIPREGSITSVAMESRGAFVVGDARIDPRFQHSPNVVGVPLIRFYAGYPIESASGDHIGVLVVFDPEPRDIRGFDESLMRTCALMIQTELEHGTPAHWEPTPA